MKIKRLKDLFIGNRIEYWVLKIRGLISKKIIYLDEEYFINLNKIAIRLFEVKKADRHELLSRAKLRIVIDQYMEYKGDIYDAAVMLLNGIVKSHAFASGNRRTALLGTIMFLYINGKRVNIRNNPYNSRVMIGIREGYYKDEELKRWLKDGEIRDFKRI